METLLGGVALAILTAMAFIAYNHPKQYVYVLYGIGAVYAVATVAGMGASVAEKRYIQIISKLPDLTPKQKSDILAALSDQMNTPDHWYHIGVAFAIYASLLWFLPHLGLTAEHRAHPKEPEKKPTRWSDL
jgi:hypothetical protein